MEKFDCTYKYKLIYVFSMPYDTHKGLLKIGEATLTTDTKPEFLTPNCRELNQAAIARIKGYTATASVNFKLEHTELAVLQKDGYTFTFKDKDVHRVLMNSGVHKVQPNGATGEEWFETTLDVAVNAIKAVKSGFPLQKRQPPKKRLQRSIFVKNRKRQLSKRSKRSKKRMKCFGMPKCALARP